MRIELSDPSRLPELCDFFREAQALARIDDESVIVDFPGQRGDADSRQLRAYLETWLRLSAAAGRSVQATILSLDG